MWTYHNWLSCGLLMSFFWLCESKCLWGNWFPKGRIRSYSLKMSPCGCRSVGWFFFLYQCLYLLLLAGPLKWKEPSASWVALFFEYIAKLLTLVLPYVLTKQSHSVLADKIQNTRHHLPPPVTCSVDISTAAPTWWVQKDGLGWVLFL